MMDPMGRSSYRLDLARSIWMTRHQASQTSKVQDAVHDAFDGEMGEYREDVFTARKLPTVGSLRSMLY